MSHLPAALATTSLPGALASTASASGFHYCTGKVLSFATRATHEDTTVQHLSPAAGMLMKLRKRLRVLLWPRSLILAAAIAAAPLPTPALAAPPLDCGVVKISRVLTGQRHGAMMQVDNPSCGAASGWICLDPDGETMSKESSKRGKSGSSGNRGRQHASAVQAAVTGGANTCVAIVASPRDS
jgi:hypothetical protein